jgi:hypothetical protein
MSDQNIKIQSTVYPEKVSQEEWMNMFEVGSACRNVQPQSHNLHSEYDFGKLKPRTPRFDFSRIVDIIKFNLL